MLYCNLHVFFCTEIAVKNILIPQNVTSGGASGSLKKFSRLAIALHILGPPHKLCCNSTTEYGGQKAIDTHRYKLLQLLLSGDATPL